MRTIVLAIGAASVSCAGGELNAPAKPDTGFYRTDYGERINGWPEGVALWWCDATHKIPRRRGLPESVGRAARLSAARNDREAVQIVVRPTKELKRLTVTASTLLGPDEAAISSREIQVLRVAYHFVHSPTDATGVRDSWPDALPPLRGPIDLPAGENQPLWVLIHVPESARPGDYAGEIRLQADGFAATVPVRLHVWSFALPRQNHLSTAFGFSPENVLRYHRLSRDEEKRRVLDLYFQCFAEHRISPYDPTPLDPIRVKWVPDATPPRADLDFSAFDRAMHQAAEKHGFTGFRLPVRGMGGGTFHARVEPQIENFGAETPEYRAMFASYVRQVEAHLREKGWLKMAYVYWFDEPAPPDYAFVRSGMQRLKDNAPGITTMLTEQPEKELAGPVDIWCPLSRNYDHAAAQGRRAAGDRFWWYICTGPKAPYCTLFIDHGATELRVWLWQTWQRDISGILVWNSNYWTSPTAFPDPKKPQDPYEDPMAYVSGYGTPSGTKKMWGNGDGRFFYPPLAAAAPGSEGSGPVIEPPVSSIRWEMLREGIEDYEFLSLLRNLLRTKAGGLAPAERQRIEALLSVPPEITRDMTKFTTDPAPIYARRAALAEAIEQLGP